MTQTSPTREGRVSVPGGDVWYRVVGEGDAVPLVVVAGGPGCSHDYLEPLAGLADERPVVFYDQLGVGKSDLVEDVGLWRIDRFVEELERVVDVVGTDRIHLFGHSYGSVFATEYALKHPTRLRSLVLAGPCLDAQRYVAGLGVLVAQLPAEMRVALERHAATGEKGFEGYREAMGEFFARHFCRLDPWPEPLERMQLNAAVYKTMWGPSEFIANGIHGDHVLTGRLGEIGVPTLLTCGRFDMTRPEETALDRASISGSVMVVFEQSSHMPHLEEEERYVEVVRGFLRGVEGG